MVPVGEGEEPFYQLGTDETKNLGAVLGDIGHHRRRTVAHLETGGHGEGVHSRFCRVGQ